MTAPRASPSSRGGVCPQSGSRLSLITVAWPSWPQAAPVFMQPSGDKQRSACGSRPALIGRLSCGVAVAGAARGLETDIGAAGRRVAAASWPAPHINAPRRPRAENEISRPGLSRLAPTRYLSAIISGGRLASSVACKLIHQRKLA